MEKSGNLRHYRFSDQNRGCLTKPPGLCLFWFISVASQFALRPSSGFRNPFLLSDSFPIAGPSGLRPAWPLHGPGTAKGTRSAWSTTILKAKPCVTSRRSDPSDGQGRRTSWTSTMDGTKQMTSQTRPLWDCHVGLPSKRAFRVVCLGQSVLAVPDRSCLGTSETTRPVLCVYFTFPLSGIPTHFIIFQSISRTLDGRTSCFIGSKTLRCISTCSDQNSWWSGARSPILLNCQSRLESINTLERLLRCIWAPTHPPDSEG